MRSGLRVRSWGCWVPGCPLCWSPRARGRTPQPGRAQSWFRCQLVTSRTPCAAPDPRAKGCTAPGLGTATLAPDQAQRFVAGWTVALGDVPVRGRSQDTAEVSSSRAEAASSAQHLPASEQLDSTQAGTPSPLSKRSLAPESGPDPTVPWGDPRAPPSEPLAVHWGAAEHPGAGLGGPQRSRHALEKPGFSLGLWTDTLPSWDSPRALT